MFSVPTAKQDNAPHILAVAQRLTFGRGVSTLRMAELAFELGMSKKTLYVHYPSKEALLQAMMDAHYQRYDALFGDVLRNPQLTFLQRLERTMQLGWELNGLLSAAVLQDFRRHAPDLLRGFEERKAAAVQQYFHLLLAEGQRAGQLRPDLSLDIVVDILLEAITYRLTPSSLQGKPYSMAEAFTTFYQLLFAGLLQEEARQQYLAGSPATK